MYNYEIIPSLQKELDKLSKKDKKVYEVMMNKIEEILKNPHHYKPLKYDLAGERRVHIMKSFVLKFETSRFVFAQCQDLKDLEHTQDANPKKKSILMSPYFSS